MTIFFPFLAPQITPLVMSDQSHRKHYGNDPIWTPPTAHLQQQTPVVSANVDGPSVEPKQIPKKIPKPIQTTTTPTPPSTATASISAAPQPEPPVPVEQIDSGVDVSPQIHEEPMSPENLPESDQQNIEEITEEMDQIQIIDENPSEFIETEANDEASPEIIAVETQEVEEEEVITEIITNNDTESATLIPELIIKSVDSDKNSSSSSSSSKNLSQKHGADEPDRVLSGTIPEYVRSNPGFKQVIEKYQIQLPPGLEKNEPPMIPENNGNVTTNNAATEAVKHDSQQQQKNQDQCPAPESEDDDADKENNIQNKKYSQEVSDILFITRTSTHVCTYTYTHVRQYKC